MRNEEIAVLIEKAKDCVLSLRVQDYVHGGASFRAWLSQISEGDYLREMEELRESWLPALLNALEAGDMILLADYLEEGVVPYLKTFLRVVEPVETGRFRVEMTLSGENTVYSKEADRYLHSNNFPAQEARLLAEHCYDPQKSRYAVWGCGLGYHVDQLYKISRKSIKITVFEEDKELLSLFRKYGIMTESEDIQFVWDEFGEKFSDAVSDRETGVLMHYPSVLKIRDAGFRGIMQDFYANWNGVIQNHIERTVNFRKNTVNCSRIVDELEPVIRGKDVVIVGGGPSVDTSREFLRNRGSKILIAVNTIVPSLTGMGVRPDYIIAMDTEPVIREDLQEVREQGIPLIVDSTACWQLAEEYGGERYIAYQAENTQAEEAAERRGAKTYQTGGSVVTLALSVAAELGARKIFFVGIDLAQPGGQTHAHGTKRGRVIEAADVRWVESVTGQPVETDLLLLSYKKWIENAITKYPDITFYNLSTCGAYIKGAYPYHDQC